MRCRPLALLAVLCCPGPPPVAGLPAQTAPAQVAVVERYDWPEGADIFLDLRRGDFALAARRDGESFALGVSLPWLQAGPLLGCGVLRQAADPLGFSARSGVFEERTSLALDASLRSSRQGAVIMPLPGLGVFLRGCSAGGGELGVFGRLPLGAGAAVEGLALRSRPEPRGISDDWYFSRSPFPGGEVTHLCGRLLLDSPRLDFSFTGGASGCTRASPGAFAMAWLRARSSEAEASVLLAGATEGYRSPGGDCPSGGVLSSAGIRLGADPRLGTLEAGWSCLVENPGFAPGREIPTRCKLKLALSRDTMPRPDVLVSMIVQAEKEVSRDADGVEVEAARCSSAVSAGLDHVETRAGISLGGADGVVLQGSLAVRPSSCLGLGMEAELTHAEAASAAATMAVSVSISRRSTRAMLKAGLEDYPVAGTAAGPARFLRITLSTSIRAE
jgi:hypothetical protein